MKLLLCNLQKDMLKGMEFIYKNMDVSIYHNIPVHNLKVQSLMEKTVSQYLIINDILK